MGGVIVCSSVELSELAAAAGGAERRPITASRTQQLLVSKYDTTWSIGSAVEQAKTGPPRQRALPTDGVSRDPSFRI